jgi:LysM repeat protein
MRLRFRDVRRSEGCLHLVHHKCTVQAAFLVSATCSGRNPLGYPATSADTRFTRRLPSAAAPALLGVAAAFAVANAPAAALADAQAPAHHTAATAATAAAQRPSATTARLLSVTRPTVRHNSAAPAKYTVGSGDTLSAIAEHFYQNPDFWPVLYWANHGQIQYANEIQAGQVLTVPVKPARIPGAPSVLGPAPVPAPATVGTSATAYEETSAPASTAQAAPVQAAPSQAASTYTGSGGSFQACVIARESGGNSQVMNSSGHYGLYQFSASTWAAYGGNPADFGHASVAEQNQVFNNAIAAGGQSNWASYDGC